MNSYSPIPALAVLLAMSFTTTTIGSQQQTQQQQMHDQNTMMASQSDIDFMKDAAFVNNAEIEMGKLALMNGTAGFGKSYGQRMVDDHTEANRQLMALADRRGVRLPTYVDLKHKAVWSHLESFVGPGFDMPYCREMIKGHQDAYMMFKRYADEGADSELKSFAEQQMDTIRTHMRLAEQNWNMLRPWNH